MGGLVAAFRFGREQPLSQAAAREGQALADEMNGTDSGCKGLAAERLVNALDLN